MHGTNREPFTAKACPLCAYGTKPPICEVPGCPHDRPFGVPLERRDTLGRRIRRPPEFTVEQMERIKQYYTYTPAWRFDLSELAKELGKSRHNICRFAKRAGYTNPHRPSNARQIEAVKKPRWQDKEHPRGFAGKQHTAATKARISVTSKTAWATQKTFGGPLVSEERSRRISERTSLMMALRPAEKNYSRTKGGHRADLGGQYFRSSWEANYARYLNLLVKLGVVENWEYEPETFWFEGIRRGVTNYRPDFRVKFKQDVSAVYVEIKGWIVPKDRTKWARMKKYYPQTKLQIVKAKEYYAIQKKWASAIPTWERRDQSGNARRVVVRSLHEAVR